MKKNAFKFFRNLVLVLFFVNSIYSQNNPPTFTSTPVTAVNSNTNYSYTITTNDTDSDVISLTSSTLPSWLSFTLDATVTSLAGSTAGFADATGTAAQFFEPYGIAIDASGTVYVADSRNNRIRKITSAGMVTTFAGSGIVGFADGTGTAAKFSLPTGLAVDGSGIIYIADRANHSIRKITSSGVVSTLAGSGTFGFADGTGAAAQFNNPWGVAVDDSGTVYVADNSNHCIRKITPAGVVTTLAGSGIAGFADGTGTAAQFDQPTDVAVDASGNVYVADFNNQRIRKITSAGEVTTLAGSGIAGYSDATGTAAQFKFPISIAVDASNTVYVADRDNQLIRKITSSGVVSTLAGSGTAGFADGTGTAANFNQPTGITVDASGIFYVSERQNHRIRKITELGSGQLSGDTTGQSGTYDVVFYADDRNNSTVDQSFTLIVNTPPVFTSTAVVSVNDNATYSYTVAIKDINKDALTLSATTKPSWLTLGSNKSVSTLIASSSTMASPKDVAVDASGNIYEVGSNNQVIKITSAGVTSILAGDTSNNPGSADGVGSIARFRGPEGIALDAQGNLYIADKNNQKIRKVTPTGAVTTLAGSGGFGFLDGVGSVAQFKNPTGIDVDASGNVYVADRNNHMIRKITPAGVVTTLAGSGTQGFADGTGTAAQFNSPTGVAVDASGNVYVADNNNNRIRKITAAGVVSTLAGSGTNFFADGIGTAAMFKNPYGLAVDGSGNVYVGDEFNNRIRKITPSGAVTTIAGSASSGNTDGSAALFSSPKGIAVDAFGNLFVADSNNNAIRKEATTITLSGDATGQAGNHSIVLTADDGKGGSTTQSFTLTVNSTLGIDKNIIKGFKFYPNPVNDVLNITAQETIKQLKVFNLLGQIIRQKMTNSTQVTLDLSLLPTGSYFVHVRTDKTIKSVKFIKR
jgi:type IX secretion system substrate protein/NHL repeat-containing protein